MRQGRLHSNPRPRSGMTTKRQPLSKCSPAQREKVAETARCIACPNVGPFVPIDPAHLAQKGYREGCDHPDCVVPLCRYCHAAFDGRDGLDLSVVVSGPAFEAELAHMLLHYHGDWVAMGNRLVGAAREVVVLDRETGERA